LCRFFDEVVSQNPVVIAVSGDAVSGDAVSGDAVSGDAVSFAGEILGSVFVSIGDVLPVARSFRRL
jgi:hypothetical protein